jgi:hypothetical protein
MNELLTSEGAYINSQTVNGTIWITSGSVGDSTPVAINGSTYSNWANYSLTLQGGWSGNPGDTTIGANSEFSVPITITNWNGSVTVNNITVEGNSATPTGLTVVTTGDFVGEDITSSNNGWAGVYISGANNVTLNGTNTFNNNYHHGFYAENIQGTIEVNNITAMNNHIGWGAILIGSNGVTLNNATFSGNGGGLDAGAPNGSITLNNVNASNNWYSYGAYLNPAKDIVLTGTNTFNNNGQYGLFANNISGNITIDGTNTFNNNGYEGLSVNNTAGSGNVTITNSSFENNNNAGLNVVSNGDVAVNNITVNGGSGSSIHTTSAVTVTNSAFSESTGNGLSVTNGGAVTVTDSAFSGSAGTGLYGWTAGDITLTRVTADGNADGGLWLKNDDGSDVTITDSTLTNNSYGMHVQAGGNLALNNVNASNNTSTSTEHLTWWSGVLAIAQGNIIINGGVYSNNTSYGIYIRTPAEIELTNVTSNGNMTGLFVEYSGTVDLRGVKASDNRQVGVDIRDTDTVTISGGTFTGNQTGLNVVSYGDVTVNNITVNDSSSRSSINTTDDVTVSNSTFSESNGGGALVNAADITIVDVTASQNDGVGLELHSSGNIVLRGANVFTNNGMGYNAGGLHAWADGSISQESGSILATNNGRHGVYMNGVESVTLSGNNNFGQNINSGLYIDSGGAVTLSGMNNFVKNGNAGLIVDSKGYVTLSGTNHFNGNMTGLFVVNSGNVDLIGVQASNNQVGVDIRETGTVNITGGSITENGIGLNVKCVQSITFDPSQERIVRGNTTNLIIDPSCPGPVIKDKTVPSYITSQSQGEFELNCIGQSGFAVNLPNGDLVNIFCPVSGKARIYRVDNTTLPAELPAGYTYASAYTLDIIQNNVSIPVITEGGYIKASFIAQPLQPGNTYSVLYWDKENSVWVPLKDFLLDENGIPRSFELFPGTPDDTRMIISGVRINPANGRVEVSTNFPGIFVLAQH